MLHKKNEAYTKPNGDFIKVNNEWIKHNDGKSLELKIEPTIEVTDITHVNYDRLVANETYSFFSFNNSEPWSGSVYLQYETVARYFEARYCIIWVKSLQYEHIGSHINNSVNYNPTVENCILLFDQPDPLYLICENSTFKNCLILVTSLMNSLKIDMVLKIT